MAGEGLWPRRRDGATSRGRLSYERTAARPPSLWPIWFGAAVVSTLWAAGPIAFVLGYRSAIEPLNRDNFALVIIAIIVLGPCAMVWAAALLLKEARLMAAQRAALAAGDPAAEIRRRQEVIARGTQPAEPEAEPPVAAEPQAEEPKKPVLAEPEPPVPLDQDPWLRALRGVPEPAPPRPAPAPKTDRNAAADPSPLLAELSRMGIQPARLLPDPQLAEIDRAFEAGDAGRGRELVNRLAGKAVVRLATRLHTDPAFALAARSFMSAPAGQGSGEADRLRRLLDVASTHGA
jgi:hypothetical protein